MPTHFTISSPNFFTANKCQSISRLWKFKEFVIENPNRAISRIGQLAEFFSVEHL